MWVCFFFFQAEDGIRDWSVTGVQTCALPISRLSKRKWILALSSATSVQRWISEELRPGSSIGLPSTVMRSEERRVGKESRYGRKTDRGTKRGRRKKNKQSMTEEELDVEDSTE